ncbi:hypothetical protein M8494_22070 [Serratia ureilytica]
MLMKAVKPWIGTFLSSASTLCMNRLVILLREAGNDLFNIDSLLCVHNGLSS